jgi:regulatory protein
MKGSNTPTTKQEAYVKMARWCAYQDRCWSEAESKIKDWGLSEQDILDVLHKLNDERFLDDERFARSYARGKHRIKRWGRLKIIQQLERKGLSSYCLRAAEEELQALAYEGTLKRVLEKKAATLQEGNFWKRRQKLWRFARQKGYEPALIQQAIQELEA